MEFSFINFTKLTTNAQQDFPQNSFYYKKSACKTTSFAITLRGSTIWRRFFSPQEKSISHLLSFLKEIKF